jgi:NADH-quinone oxidoreductase subunit N
MLDDLDRIGPVIAMAAVAALILVWDVLPRGKPLPPARGRTLQLFALLGPIISAAWAGSHLARNEAPTFSFANSVVLDDFSLYFSFLFAGIAAAVILASVDYAKRFGEYEAEFYSLLLFATGAMILLANSRDLILIFVALELTSISQYIMAALQRDERSTEASIKYLLMGAIASAVILYGMAYLFGLTGTTRLVAPDGQTSIASVIAERGDTMRAGLLLASVLLITGLAFKMAVVPFQMWVPDVYQGAPSPVVAFLSVASKAAGFAVVLRIFFEGLPNQVISDSWSLIFAIIAAISMTVGNLLALVQTDMKRLLGYSSIAQAGYLMVGLAAVSASDGSFNVGASSVMFFLGAYAMTNLGAFIVVIAISQRTGASAISDYAGLARRSPLLAAALGFALVSLTGIPPTAGFVAKVYIFNAGIEANLVWLVVIAVLNSVVSAFYYLRITGMMFTAEPASTESLTTSIGLKLALTVAVAGIIFVGVVPSPLLHAARDAASVLVQ